MSPSETQSTSPATSKIRLYAHKGVLHVFEDAIVAMPSGPWQFYTLIHNSFVNPPVGTPTPIPEDQHLVGVFTDESSLAAGVVVATRNDLFPIGFFLRNHFNFVGVRVAHDHIRLQRADRTERQVPFIIKTEG